MPTYISPRFSFPVELWAKIFRYATEIPGALDADPDTFNQQRLQYMLLQSYKVKTTLRLVCRSWRDISAPLMFEYLTLCDEPANRSFYRSIPLLARLLRTQPPQSTVFAKGRWIRRIDVVICSKPAAIDFAFILQYCPRLTVLNYSLNCQVVRETPSMLLDALLKHTTATLRRISWQCGRNCALPARYFSLCSNLKTLSVKVTGSGIANPPEQGCYSMLCLTSLSMEGLNAEERQAITDNWNLPSLSHIKQGTSWSTMLAVFIPRRQPPARGLIKLPTSHRSKSVSLHGIRWEEIQIKPGDATRTLRKTTWVGLKLRDVLYEADDVLLSRIKRFFDSLIGVERAPDPFLHSQCIRVLDMGVDMIKKEDADLFAQLAGCCADAGIPFLDWDLRPFSMS